MGCSLGNESGRVYSWCLIRFPLADGKLIADKPIKKTAAGGSGAAVVKVSAPLGAGAFSISSPPFLCARTTTYYAHKKDSVLIFI